MDSHGEKGVLFRVASLRKIKPNDVQVETHRNIEPMGKAQRQKTRGRQKANIPIRQGVTK